MTNANGHMDMAQKIQDTLDKVESDGPKGWSHPMAQIRIPNTALATKSEME